MNLANFLLSANRALLGHVTPNLRAVYLEDVEGVITLFFYYDHPPTEDEEELANLTDTEFLSDFPEEKIDFKIITKPFPDHIPNKGRCVYFRYEGE